MVSERTLGIGELSRLTGASVRSLRHYEARGVLAADRTATGRRRFRPEDVETVRRIRLLLEAGLPLAIIEKMLPCFHDTGATLGACVQEYLSEHRRAVRERLAQLEAQKSTLRRLESLLV